MVWPIALHVKFPSLLLSHALGSVMNTNGLEEALMVHHPGPDHLELETLSDLIIGYFMASIPYPNFGSLQHPMA